MSSVRLVRCPFCSRRFNVTDVAAGTRLRCGYCTAVLVVPASSSRPLLRFRPTRRGLLISGASAAAIALLALGVSWLLRPPAPAPAEPAVAAVPPAVPPGGESRPPNDPNVFDELSLRKQEIIEEFGNGVLWYSGVKPYLVALEPSPRYLEDQLIQDYAGRLETLHTAFRREFADPLGLEKVDAVMPVIVLNSRQSFDRYFEKRDRRRLSAAIKGIYEYDRRRVVVYHDFNVPFEVLFHEGAHQLMHYFALRESNGEVRRLQGGTYWFQEGLGTYFEGFRRAPDGSVTIEVGSNAGRLATLKQTLAQRGMKDFIPLSVLAGMSVSEFWDWYELGMQREPEETTRKAQLYYAESWAFLHFLRHQGGELRSVFDEYFKAELGGRGRKDVFERMLRERTGYELSDLNQRFVDFILALK
jgi:hypothetical protein